MKSEPKPLPLSKEYFEQEAQQKLVHGDIFTFKNPVITIKTKGRTYGALSRHVDELGVKLPDLALGTACFQDPYIFVALWDDENAYSHRLMADCAVAILNVAHRNDVKLIAMPPLGGKEGMTHLWIVESALFDAGEPMDNAGFEIPKHVYVTNKKINR